MMKVWMLLIVCGCFLCGCSPVTGTKKPAASQSEAAAAGQTAAISPTAPTRVETVIGNDISWKAEYTFVGMDREDMTLYQSADKGMTWHFVTGSSQPGNTVPGGQKAGFAFTGRNTGWIVTNGPWEGKVCLYATSDGGKSWKAVALAVPKPLQTSQIKSFVPYFFDSSAAILVTYPQTETGQPQQLFYLTLDGGTTWKAYYNKTRGKAGRLSWVSEPSVANQTRYTVTLDSGKWDFSGLDWVQLKMK